MRKTVDLPAKNTLSKYFAAELEAGQQEAKLQVGTFILDSILGRGGIRDDRARATLAIFYAKTRMGWKETTSLPGFAAFLADRHACRLARSCRRL